MARLLNFWERSREQPFKWGTCDCVLWAADYVAEKTGRHPAPHLVGSYETAFGARRLVLKSGGLVNLISGQMAGFSRGSEVGIFMLNGTKICGVKSGDSVAFKTHNGLLITREASLVKGWDI